MSDTAAVQGFTFIELIVTVILMLLLSGFVIAGYNGFNTSQAVIQGAESLKSNLILARTEAISGNIPSGEDCDELVGYQIDFISDTQYTSVALCTVGGARVPVGGKATYTLPKTVHFSPVPSSIIFYVLGRGASQNSIITLQGITKSLSISVSKSGNISDSPPAAPPP